MPDICMCVSAICPARRNCYRHFESGTQPSELQSVFVLGDEGSPSEDEDCLFFWPAGQLELPFLPLPTSELRP